MQGIYILASGEVELILRKGKINPSVNLNDPLMRRDHMYNFKRIIREPYIFGVEELLMNPNRKTRIFDARVMSLNCCFYILPLDVAMS